MGGRVVVVVEAVRTAIGRGHAERGDFRTTHPNELLGACFRALLDRTDVPAADVQDVLVGCVHQVGEQGVNVGRNAWLQAGLPPDVPASTIDLQCGSSLRAVNASAALIACGVADVVVAAGVEHMGHIPLTVTAELEDRLGTPWPPEFLRNYELVPLGEASDRMAGRWEIKREELDHYALRSHHLAAAAVESGRFDREVVPVTVGHNGEARVVERDQGIRLDTSYEALSGLPPAFHADGTTTAGNSSQISDGASALMLMSESKALELGLEPRARIVDQVTVGVDPVLMLEGPIPATRQILERNALTVADLDLIEINEAFASVVLAWQRETGADLERVNVNGGAIALGHPLGASGARILTTLVHELERRNGTHGLAAMCCRGGLGTATLVERLLQ